MKYRHVNGPVYRRYAATPMIVNSKLDDEYGIEAHSFVELEEQRHVKSKYAPGKPNQQNDVSRKGRLGKTR